MPTKSLVWVGGWEGGEFQLFHAREDFPEILELLVLTLDM